MTNPVFNNISGKILISSPYIRFGEVFHKSVIYVLSHSESGAIGLIVNHLVNQMPFKKIFKAMNNNISDPGENILPVYLGGPVELEKAFLLHSGEYKKNLLFKFKDNLAVSSNSEILSDLASGNGPEKSLFIIGYTVWQAGELEHELENNLWIVSECDKDLIFSDKNDQKWLTALKRLGIEYSHFAASAGHC